MISLSASLAGSCPAAYRIESREAAVPLPVVLWRVTSEQPLFLAACYAADRVLSVTTESLGDSGVAVQGAGEQAASTAAATAARPHAVFALT
jgi:hypothetical protein